MSDDISLEDLLLQCEQAEQRMSAKNPHRLLIGQCRVALLDLAERVWVKEGHSEGFLVQPGDSTAVE